jgi:hypothetical protein
MNLSLAAGVGFDRGPVDPRMMGLVGGKGGAVCGGERKCSACAKNRTAQGRWV